MSEPDGTVTTQASFTIGLEPAEPALEGSARFDFEKVWTGGLTGTSRGVMLSAGDPSRGNAGYVAIEVFDGTIDGRRGRIAFQQFGTMRAGDVALRYEVAPGSGTDELTGLTGELDLTIVDGSHTVTFRFQAG